MSTRTRLRPAVGTTLFVLVLAGCSAAPMSPTTAGPSSNAPATSATASTDAALTLTMATTSLGSALVDGKGMTLYLFTKDSSNHSVCEGQCLIAWPPLLGVPKAGAGVDLTKLGSFQRADGRTQASYNGWPLYYWKDDTRPGDVSGQNVNKVWFVIDADGNAVTSG